MSVRIPDMCVCNNDSFGPEHIAPCFNAKPERVGSYSPAPAFNLSEPPIALVNRKRGAVPFVSTVARRSARDELQGEMEIISND